MVLPAPFQWVNSFSFPFKHLAVNPHYVVLCCCRSWWQRFCFKYFVIYQYFFAKCLVSVEGAFSSIHINEPSSPALMISCLLTALGKLFNTSIAVVKLLLEAIFFNTIPFPNPKILDVVLHPKIACNTSKFLHMSILFFS